MRGEQERICAVVTAYFPDAAFGQRLAHVLPQVDALVVIDNTPGGGCTKRLDSLFSQTQHATVIELGDNKGIATALNKGLDHALANHCSLMVSLDQDSVCYPDMIDTLMTVRNEVPIQTAVIGGNYFDARNGISKIPVSGNKNWILQKTVITSGCMIETSIAKELGGFREDYFIDQVDHEFCLRMRAHGYAVAMTRKPVMSHSVGEDNGPSIPVLGILPGQSPSRKYYVARNSLITIANHFHTDTTWCFIRLFRLVLSLPLTLVLEEHRLTNAKAFLLGCLDAARRRMGPCPWMSLTEPRY